MRYSRQHKDETHNRLLKKAAEEFRRRGVQGTGIASLMRQLGLTHGGFYAHFDSKNELVAQATGPMFEEGLTGWLNSNKGMSGLGKNDPFVLSKSYPHEEQDLAQCKCVSASSSTPKACKSLLPRRGFAMGTDKNTGLGFGAGQNKHSRHRGVGHSSRANHDNFSQVPTQGPSEAKARAVIGAPK